MTLAQVERLRKDERELDNRIYRLKKQGKDNLVRKLTIKRGFLKQSICDSYNETQQGVVLARRGGFPPYVNYKQYIMITYEFYNTETNEIEEHRMSYKDLDKFKSDNPNLEK